MTGWQLNLETGGFDYYVNGKRAGCVLRASWCRWTAYAASGTSGLIALNEFWFLSSAKGCVTKAVAVG